MLRGGAKTIRTTRYFMLVALMAALFATGTVCADTPTANFSNTEFSINDRLLIDIECSDRKAGDAFCSYKTDMQYSKYLNTPLSAHESYLLSDSEQDQRQVNLLAIFRLALEEFKFLSNVRLYWELTEQNLEALAIKLRLKGEIPLNETAMQEHAMDKGQKDRSPSTHGHLRPASRHSSALALLIPSKIKWNLGVNPNDMTVFGELNLNAYMTLSGEIGDINRVGVYFQYAF